jgi:hypothetical protein
MKALALGLAMALSFGITGCTLVGKAVTGAAVGGVAGWFIGGPPGAAIGAGAGAVAVPIIVD